MNRLRCLLFGVALLAAGPAAACSMIPGYKVPTNLELTAQADTIVIAVVEKQRPSKDRWSAAVVARPMTLLKGAALPNVIELGGVIADDPRTRDLEASAPRELRAPHPGALSGGCVRHIFAKGMKLVLFLKSDESGRLVPYRSAFSRDAEDVTDENALWVKAVREYVPISLAPRGKRKALLRERIVSLRAMAADPDAQVIADDLAIELSDMHRTVR